MTYAAVACAAGTGGALTWWLVAYAAAPLESSGRTYGIVRTSVAAMGAGAGAALAISDVDSPQNNCWELPALICWSASLLTAASCDAVTHRVPTALTRQAMVATFALLLGAGAIQHEAKTVVVACGVSGLAGAVTVVVRRLSHLGLGDVRLAALGGLGLGNVTDVGVLAGTCAFAVVGVFTATRRQSSTFPLGPALAAGFLIAAIA